MEALLILPFDHRGSFRKKVFSIEGRDPTDDELTRIKDAKRVIFDAYLKVLGEGLITKENSAILVDEEYGTEILNDANSQGIMTCTPLEKSGQNVFDFDEGDPGYQEQVSRLNPTFAKVLVRYNPEADSEEDKKLQVERLKKLGDWLKETNRKYLFELLVIASDEQMEEAGGDKTRYEAEQRPDLTAQAIRDFQDGGIRPDVWKLEGQETTADMEKVAAPIREANPDAVIVVLGRGESEEKARYWLEQAKSVQGVVGFAVGRTIFLEPLRSYVEGNINREDAVAKVAENYGNFVKLWME